MDPRDQTLQAAAPTQKLREKIREYTKSHREQLRTNTCDSLRFGIGEIKTRIQELDNLTEKDVIGLAGRIKRRKHATQDDMYRLSHAFLQDVKNIETFSKITGAVQVLIKELTGNDSERRLSSAECLCNFSLGEEPVCDKLASLAGTYLVTYLHTTEPQLVRLSLWTLANILATGRKGASILIQMQIVPQLWKLYVDDTKADSISDFREDSAICLQIIASKSTILLRSIDLDYILQHFTEKNPTCTASEYHLQIIFHTIFTQQNLVESFSSSQQLYLINCSLNHICNTKNFQTPEQHVKILYSVRVLSNLLAAQPSCYSIFLRQLSSVWHINVVNVFNHLFSFQNRYLTQEVLWFLKNVLTLENSITPVQTNILEKINIPSSHFHSLGKNTDVESMTY